MKRQIRRNCFETNSSSMHSLVILKDGTLNHELNEEYKLYLDNDGIMEFWRDDDLNFGRHPFRYLHTTRDKIKYAIASLCGYCEDAEETFRGIEKIVMELFPECKGIKLPKDDWKDDTNYYGWVDEDILSPFLKKNNIGLKDFLIDDKYVVIVDGDEYCIFDDMVKSGIINMGNIESEFPKRM